MGISCNSVFTDHCSAFLVHSLSKMRVPFRSTEFLRFLRSTPEQKQIRPSRPPLNWNFLCEVLISRVAGN